MTFSSGNMKRYHIVLWGVRFIFPDRVYFRKFIQISYSHCFKDYLILIWHPRLYSRHNYHLWRDCLVSLWFSQHFHFFQFKSNFTRNLQCSRGSLYLNIICRIVRNNKRQGENWPKQVSQVMSRYDTVSRRVILGF